MRTPEEIREYQRKWREANRDKRRAYAKKYHKQWYEKNKADKLKKNKEWAKKNPQKIKQIRKKHYLVGGGKEQALNWQKNNRKKCVEATQRYVAKNHHVVREKERIRKKTVDGVYSRYRQSAKRRNYCFALTRKHFEVLLKSDCYYCGVKEAGGVDRSHNSYGYSKKNSVPCCTPCNMMKKTLSAKDFINQATRIAKHNLMV